MLLQWRGNSKIFQKYIRNSTVTQQIAAYHSQLCVASDQEYLSGSSMSLLLQLLHLSLMVQEKYSGITLKDVKYVLPLKTLQNAINAKFSEDSQKRNLRQYHYSFDKINYI